MWWLTSDKWKREKEDRRSSILSSSFKDARVAVSGVSGYSSQPYKGTVSLLGNGSTGALAICFRRALIKKKHFRDILHFTLFLWSSIF